tara:strand:- start:48 stop:281 length:234 start_codon:yes stop_codon:yes gene_type:complete
MNSELRSSIIDLIDFAKQKTISNMLEMKTRGDIQIDEATMRKISNTIDSSISQALSLGFKNVETVFSHEMKKLKGKK